MFPSLMRIPINAGSLCNVKYISISKLNKDVCIIKLSKLKSSQLSTCFHYNQDSPGTQVQSLDQEGPLEKGMAIVKAMVFPVVMYECELDHREG